MKTPSQNLLSMIISVFLVGLLIASCKSEQPIDLGIKGNSQGETAENTSEVHTQVVDSGFKPGEDGFSFANYTNQGDVINLTAVEMQRMFGDQVCANFIDGTCTLSPPAREWMEKSNNAMNGGHCEGMAVLSELIYYGKIDPEKFGASQTIDLTLSDNQTLQREIAYWWVTQATYPGASDKVNQSPSKVVETLQETFAQGKNIIDEAWAMGIYQPDMSGGHSITPIAVDDQGGGIFHISVYDNNFPGDARAIIVDTNVDTWKYNGSINLNDASKIYQGNQSTKTLELVAISPRLGQQDCSFCEDGNQSWFKGSKVGEIDSDQEYFEIWMEGEANLLILNHQEQRLGFVDREFVEEIPGASTHWMKRSPETNEVSINPIYRIPQGPAFEFFIDSARLESEISSELSVIAKGYFISIDGIQLQPGSQDQVSMGMREDGTGQLIYWPYSSETPVVMAGIETSGADFVYRARAVSLESEED